MKGKFLLQILMLCIVISCNSLNSNKVSNSSVSNTDKSDSLANKSVDGVDYLDLGFKLMDSETIGDIKRGITIEKVKALLGEPENILTIDTSQVDGGLYQSIEYPKLGVSNVLTKQPDSAKRVENILISEPCAFKTSKKIGVGSSLDEVMSAYKESINPEFSSNDYIIVGSVYGGIVFTLENLKVKSIYIGVSAD